MNTQVLNAFEGYREQPVIKQARKLAVQGDDERDFSPLGCEIQLAEGTGR